MRAWIGIAGALLIAGTAAAGEPAKTLSGKVREVSGGPLGRARAMLTTSSGDTFELRGRTPLDAHELRRLSGLVVSVDAVQPDLAPGAVEVLRYRILDVGGGTTPRVGHFATLDIQGQARLLFVDETGTAEVLPKGWTRKMKRHIGSKTWMVGTRTDGRFRVKRWGILRPRRPETTKP